MTRRNLALIRDGAIFVAVMLFWAAVTLGLLVVAAVMIGGG